VKMAFLRWHHIPHGAEPGSDLLGSVTFGGHA